MGGLNNAGRRLNAASRLRLGVPLRLALAQIVLGGAHRRRAACRTGRSPPRSSTATRQSSHILMTSRRCAESLNIQCLPSSLAATRSIVLFTPNGLPQRMQLERLFFLEHARGAVAARKSSCGLSVMTFSGQVALHSPHCTQASSAKRSIGRSGSSDSAPVGQADTQERQSVQPSTLISTAPNGAPSRQRHDIDRRRRRALQFAQREPHHVALAADRRKARRPRRRRQHRDGAQGVAQRIGIVGLDGGDAAGAEAEARQGSARPARWSCADPVDVVARLGAQQEAHRARAVGESRGDRFEADLRHLVDRERQHIRRQAVAVPRQRIDQRGAVRPRHAAARPGARRRPRDRR